MTDAQWRDVRDILRRIGVIADSVMASPERWTPRVPLRATLEWEQRWYANWELRKLPTPTQVRLALVAHGVQPSGALDWTISPCGVTSQFID
jgi:hypothetical protein